MAEIFKEMVELAEGFDLKGNYLYIPGWNMDITSPRVTERDYNLPLLIRRAVDGWNRIPPWFIRQVEKGVHIDRDLITNSFYFYADAKPTNILTVEEVCLLKALEEVLK